MDFDLFLSSPRWEILQIIALNPSSPAEIAKKLNTTVSYISQQLKLLDAAGLIVKKKTGEVKKGKPRTLFCLSNELLYLITLTKNFSEKKLIYLTEHHKTIIKIWLLYEPALHYTVEKFFWKLESNLNELKAIFIETSEIEPRILIVSDNKALKLKIDSFAKKLDKKINYLFISENQLEKFLSKNLVALYDSTNILNQLKGGGKNE